MIDAKMRFRQLWMDHVLWTRQYVVSTLASIPDAKAAADRLLTNQDEMAIELGRYFGKEAEMNLSRLFRQHITIAIEALYSGMDKDVLESWRMNAEEIASYLAQINPRYDFSQFYYMLNSHLNMTLEYVRARLDGNWSGDVIYFQQNFDQAMEMADEMAKGVC